MKKFIKVVLIILFIFINIVIFELFRAAFGFCYNHASITYLGTAKGRESSQFDSPDFWLNHLYLYCGNGYGLFSDAREYGQAADACWFKDYDFDLKRKEGKTYIYSYGVPIKRLEYYKGNKTVWNQYYNRAVFSKDDFKEGIYYFYEMDNIGLGDMMMDDQYYLEEEMEEVVKGLKIFYSIYGFAILVFITIRILRARRIRRLDKD